MTGLSHKDTILVWNDAVLTYDKGRTHHKEALQTLQQIENPSAKICFNIGNITLSLGDLVGALQAFQACIEKDAHLAVAHFQLGLCFYRKHKYVDSKAAYERAVKCLRGNKYIDYKQLGMTCKLYECEIKYNLALSYQALLTTPELAIQVLEEALANKVEAKHEIIGTAITKFKQGDKCDPFTIPSNLFCPPASKVANLKNVDYLGKAKVVSQLNIPETSPNAARSRSPSPAARPRKPPPSPINAFRPIETPPPVTSPQLSPPISAGPLSKSPMISPTPNVVKLKDSLVNWNEGILEYDRKNFKGAVECFLKITEPSAKILFNLASLQVKMGETDAAKHTLQSAISKDEHLAIAHYLLGNLYCKANKADDAWRAYEKCLECFRSNLFIDYKQLGMIYRLYQCEALYNQAYTYDKLGEVDWCTKMLEDAQKCKVEDRHSVIDTAVKNYKQGTLFTIMDIPQNLVFRPPKDKVANLQKQDYLGKQKVVSELKDKKPQINNNVYDGEYLPMAPGLIKHENTYTHGVPQNTQNAQAIPIVPLRSTSLNSDSKNSQSPGPPNKRPPIVPPIIRENSFDSFDSDSFDDEDLFEDEYINKPVPVPRRFSPDKLLPSLPTPPSRPVPSPWDSPNNFNRASPSLDEARTDSIDEPVREPPRNISGSPPQNISPAIFTSSKPRKISHGPPSKPLPKPRHSSVPSEPLLDPSDKNRKISTGPPSKPLPLSPTSGSPTPPELMQDESNRIRMISRGPPSKPLPKSPRSSPVPPKRPPPPNGSLQGQNDPALAQRKISPGPPNKQLPPPPLKKLPVLPNRSPPLH